MNEAKKEIRRQIKALAASCKNYKEGSRSVCKKITESTQFKTAEIILAYMALPDEAELSEVINAAIAQGKKVYIPRVFPESGTIEFYRYLSQQQKSTEKGNFGIQEPQITENSELFTPENISTQKAQQGCLENPKIMVLVPGRAFTKEGKRLGRGKGYYDKYLPRLCGKAFLAGVCLQFQLLQDLPADTDDIRMDFIFQE